MIADRRLYLDRSQTRVVEASTVEAAFLLAAKGHEIPVAAITRLGLERVDGRVQQQGQEETQELAAVVQTPRPTRRSRRRGGAKPPIFLPPEGE
jgi:hypothetical protein